MAPKQNRKVQKDPHCPLLPGNEAVYRKSPTAHCSKVGWLRTQQIPLPNTLEQCGMCGRSSTANSSLAVL